MLISFDTEPYNKEKFSRPWLAKVDFSKGHQGVLTFGIFIGYPGEEGILEIEAEPGDIICRGQKNYAQHAPTNPTWFRINEGGKPIEFLSKAAAYKYFRDKEKENV